MTLYSKQSNTLANRNFKLQSVHNANVYKRRVTYQKLQKPKS